MSALAAAVGAVFVYMTVWFVSAAFRRDNSLADIAWGPGFMLVAWVSFVLGGGSGRSFIVSLAVSLWALRLATHISLRNHGKGEDPRYVKMRAGWGRHVLLFSFLQVFMLQGLLLLLVAQPFIWINAGTQSPWTFVDTIGLVLWAVGFAFETVGDLQLRRFLSDASNRGKIMQSGLWRYTRHPNYFGEVTLWWGIFLIALSSGGWWTAIGPLTISFLILKVSGIPMLEKPFEANPDFQAYKRRTSAFFPLPPRK